MEIYMWCACGSNPTYVSKVKKYAEENNLELKVYETRYDKDRRTPHLEYLAQLNAPSNFTPILVKDGQVTYLKDFDGQVL